MLWEDGFHGDPSLALTGACEQVLGLDVFLFISSALHCSVDPLEVLLLLQEPLLLSNWACIGPLGACVSNQSATLFTAAHYLSQEAFLSLGSGHSARVLRVQAVVHVRTATRRGPRSFQVAGHLAQRQLALSFDLLEAVLVPKVSLSDGLALQYEVDVGTVWLCLLSLGARGCLLSR